VNPIATHHEHQFTNLLDQILPDASIAVLRGDVSKFDANRSFRRTGKGVYDMDDLRFRTQKMLEFAQAIRDQNDGREIYALSYSYGASILASMLFDDPRLFERAALMHPLISNTPNPRPVLSSKRILITAGQHGPISPLKLSRSVVGWLQAQGANVEAFIAPADMKSVLLN